MSRKISLFIYFLLAINFLYVLSGVLHIPMQSVDVVGIWLFKAKAFFVEGGFPWQTLNNPDFLLFHPQYPLLLPFLYSGFYFVLGKVWELPILLLYPIYYLFILWLVFQVLLKLKLTSWQALIYVYLYSMLSPLLAQAGRMHAGSADIVIVLLAWLIILLWQRFNNINMWLIVFLVMIASQIKLEGLFLGTIIFSFPITKIKKINLLLLAALPFLLWNYFVKATAIPSDFIFVVPGWNDLINRSGLIISLTGQEMLNFKNWYIFWLLFWPAILFGTWSKKEQPAITLGWVSLIITSAYILVYLTVTTDVKAHIGSSIDRVLFQLTPFLYPIFVVQSQKQLKHLSYIFHK
jgi:hypothetical protein